MSARKTNHSIRANLHAGAAEPKARNSIAKRVKG